MEAPDRNGRGWLRALGLLALATALSVVHPAVLVAVPFILLVFAIPGRRATAILLASLAAILVLGGPSDSGLWSLERAWGLLLGGWFTALTLSRPRAHFIPRAIGAVAGTTLVMVLLLLIRPGGWEIVDWTVTSRMEEGIATALEVLRLVRGEDALPQAFMTAVLETASLQARIFPAMLALASVAGLGVAWWLYVRLARRGDGGVGPLEEFRFNDQLVWVLITGLTLFLLGSSDGVSRAGVNAMVFMGGLYVVRGAGVVVFLSGGVSVLGVLLLCVGMVFLAPVIITGAMIIGLGDTWLDLRKRAGAALGRP
jgi:hypothetical protein